MKVILRYLLTAGLFFMIGFSYMYHVPKFKTWLIVKIEELSTKHLPIRILAGSVEASFYPPGISVKNIRALPKGDLAKKLAPVRIKSISLMLRPQSLLSGDFRVSEIILDKPEVTLILDKNESKSVTEGQALPSLKELLSVPIQKIEMTNALLQLKSQNAEILTRAEDLFLSLDNRNDSIFVTLQAPQLLIKRSKSNTAKVSLETSFLLNEEEISVRGIKVKEEDSFLIGSGFLKGQIGSLKFKEISFKTRAHLELAPTLETLKSISKEMTLPEITGSLDIETLVTQTSETETIKINSNIQTQNIFVNQFHIDQVNGDVSLENNTLTSQELVIKNAAGRVSLKNLSFQLAKQNEFSAIVGLDNMELSQLLVQLSVGRTPLRLLMNSAIPCQGHLLPEFNVSCTGKLHGHDFSVWNDETKVTLVALENFSIDGFVTADTNAVTTKAKIMIGDSSGEATADINYKTGFDIKYSTNELNFKNIKNLANLKLEGRSAIQGSTQGDSQSAKFAFKMKSNDVWFEDYGLGNATADVNYLSGNLHFKNIQGVFNTTRYIANVSVDLNKNRIKADGRLGFAEARDLQQVFSRKVSLPFEIFGQTSARLSAEGPFELSQLTYELDSTVLRGSVGPEIFDEVRFHVTSQKGFVKTQNVYLKKGLGSASMSGDAKPDGNINTVIKGKNFRLEDLSVFNKNESSVQGSVNFEMALNGHVLGPDARMKGQVTDTLIGREPIPDSNFEFQFNRANFSGQTSFLDDRLSLNFDIPFDLDKPFKFQAKAEKWDFTPLFGLISKDASIREFETELTTQINLSSPKGGFWASTGQANINTLKIRRGNLELYNPSPLKIQFDDGRMNIKNFLIQGDNTFLKVAAENSTQSDFNVSVNGKIEMSLVSFLAPFISDLRGILSVAGQLDGNAASPRVIGSAFIEKGHAKLREVPHPFENVKADILFNQQRVVINSLTSTFAGGSAFAEGHIEIKALKQTPVNIRGRFDKVNLQIPKDFSTQGSGDFKLTGEWFPFLLSGTYNMTGGEITRTFGDEALQTNVVKRSSFLPEILLEKGFSPLKLDLQTYFPQGLMVKNNLVETEARGSLRITGSPEDPIMLGEITTPAGGKLMFRDVPFEITNSSIKFNNPTKNNASLYASASTRIKDYDINLIVQGTQENYQIILRSTPNLAEQEIISLLALGYTTEQLENVQSDEQIDQQSYEIGSALLSNNPFGNEIRNKYGVNVRFGSAVDDANNVSPKVIISKQWSPRINTSASRTIGNSVTQDVKLEYQLNRNVSVIGSWLGKEYSEENETSESQSKNTDIFGLDLQYKVEFK